MPNGASHPKIHFQSQIQRNIVLCAMLASFLGATLEASFIVLFAILNFVCGTIWNYTWRQLLLHCLMIRAEGRPLSSHFCRLKEPKPSSVEAKAILLLQSWRRLYLWLSKSDRDQFVTTPCLFIIFVLHCILYGARLQLWTSPSWDWMQNIARIAKLPYLMSEL